MKKETLIQQTNTYIEKRTTPKGRFHNSNLILGQINGRHNTQLRTRFLKYLANQS